MKIRSLIIDDNPFNIEQLMDLLKQNHDNIEVIGFAKNGKEGLELINKKKPELIFLDVEMPDMTGFDMLSEVNDISFKTIFITSFSHYAIKAIRFNALDYLLKPIDQKELDLAINRYIKNVDSSKNENHVKQALINLKTKNINDQVLFLQTQKGELRFSLKNIIKIEGDRNYSYIHLTKQSRKLSSKTLAFFEEILSDKGFNRCHRSFLVNRIHIDHIDKNNYFVLKNQSKIPISRRKKNNVRIWFEHGLK